MHAGEEVTFDYFGGGTYALSLTSVSQDSQTTDVSLSEGEDAGAVPLTGVGQKTTEMLLRRLEERLQPLEDLEICEELGFTLAQRS